jgi:NAD(P)-dependent dehydrogenase (short-subunit alcohol dehydrogenase family)
MRDLAGRTVVITGAASGIGLGIAHALAAAGMNLVLADVEGFALARAVIDLTTHGTKVRGLTTDVTDREAVFALADRAYDDFGRVDVLCSNAGVGAFPPIADATAADWDWVMSVNLGGTVNCLLAFLPRMKEQPGEKHIVLTASIAGLAPLGLTIYATTKYAIVGMGESLVQESETHGYGIGVSILCPGGVDTNFGTSDRNRPDGAVGGQLAPTARRGSDPDRRYPAMDPREVGVRVRDAIVDGDLYVVTHPHTRALVEERSTRLGAAYDKIADRA